MPEFTLFRLCLEPSKLYLFFRYVKDAPIGFGYVIEQ